MGDSLTAERDGSIIPANPYPKPRATMPGNKCYFFREVYPTCIDPASRTQAAVVAAEASASNTSTGRRVIYASEPVVVPLSPAPARQRKEL